MALQVMFTLQIPVEVKREGKWFVSRTPALDVYSQGPSEKKAIQNLVEAVRLFLSSCFERGTLDQVLKESGFRPSRSSHPSRRKKGKLVDVPLPFRIDRKGSEECRA